MRFVLTALALTCATTAAAANDGNDGNTTCNAASDYAKSVMEARQQGVPAAEMVKRADLVPPGSRDLALMMMRTAYDLPQQDDATAQQQAIDSFGQHMRDECMKSF